MGAAGLAAVSASRSPHTELQGTWDTHNDLVNRNQNCMDMYNANKEQHYHSECGTPLHDALMRWVSLCELDQSIVVVVGGSRVIRTARQPVLQTVGAVALKREVDIKYEIIF